jgi:hypothetical protein
MILVLPRPASHPQDGSPFCLGFSGSRDFTLGWAELRQKTSGLTLFWGKREDRIVRMGVSDPVPFFPYVYLRKSAKSADSPARIHPRPRSILRMRAP